MAQVAMSCSSPSVLIVDDDEHICRLYREFLSSCGFYSEAVTTPDAAEQLLKRKRFDVVLLDVFLGNKNSLDCIGRFLSLDPRAKIIILTGQSSVALAVEAMRKGASHFFEKELGPDVIARELNSIISASAGCPLDGQLNETFGFIGSSLAMRSVLEAIEKCKDVNTNVLISGESGTGKELVARALHKASQRSSSPFYAINCGAIPETLLESELFGYRKGAFTDAKTDKKGIFELCSSGTLLLDEIGEIPLALQVKLLRVLQDREVRALGSDRPIVVDTRVIAATNRDLELECREGRFRWDLYYRLAILKIRIPPLRDRKEDIPVLVEHFLEKFNKRFGRTVKMPGPELMARFLAHDWPGNIRELQNAVERGVVLAKNDQMEFEAIFDGRANPDEFNRVEVAESDSLSSFRAARDRFERDYLMSLLRVTQGNISEAARISNQHRPHLYRLIRRHKLRVEAFR